MKANKNEKGKKAKAGQPIGHSYSLPLNYKNFRSFYLFFMCIKGWVRHPVYLIILAGEIFISKNPVDIKYLLDLPTQRL